MFDKVLDDLKACERDLQMIANDKATDMYAFYKLRNIIYTLEDTRKNICSIADECMSVPKVTNTVGKAARFETAGELLEFLLGLNERDLRKPVTIGKNEWDDRLYAKYVGVEYEVDWVRNDDKDVIICCK